MVNRFYKYAPSAWVAETENDFTAGQEISMTNKYGKEKPYIVFKLLHSKEKTRSKKNYYSILPIENKNYFERRAERMARAVENSKKKSDAYYEKSQNGSDFLSLGEPIKIGHHSEKRHRKLIESNNNAMGKCVEYAEKAKTQAERLEYYESMIDNINLSMPESIEFYTIELEKLKFEHQNLKNNPHLRSHSFSLPYAKKAVTECEKKLNIAIKLWGDE